MLAVELSICVQFPYKYDKISLFVICLFLSVISLWVFENSFLIAGLILFRLLRDFRLSQLEFYLISGFDFKMISVYSAIKELF